MTQSERWTGRFGDDAAGIRSAEDAAHCADDSDIFSGEELNGC